MLSQIKFLFINHLSGYVNHKKFQKKNSKKSIKYHIIKLFYYKLKGKFRNQALATPNRILDIVTISNYFTSPHINTFLKQFFFYKVNDLFN